MVLEKDVARLQLEKDLLEAAGEILKKGKGINLEKLTNQEKTILIGALSKKYNPNILLAILKISKSSYYYQRKALKKDDKYLEMRETIKSLFQSNKARYGYRRIHQLMKNSGLILSEKVVRRIMKEESLFVYCKRRRKYSSYAGEITPNVENLLNRDFFATKPNQKWLTDITEFSINAGKVYLSPIIDCFDGLVVAWTVGIIPNSELTNTMLKEAISTLKNNEHPIVHTDRGVHYRTLEWISIMKDSNLRRSMSKKACSPDNSACEGFFGRLKMKCFTIRTGNTLL